MNYIEALNILDSKHGDKNRKRLANNTYLVRHDEYIGVLLHQTEVVKLYPKHAELYSGGWLTMTTKERISEYSPIRICQEKSLWYIHKNHQTWPLKVSDLPMFYEGIKVKYDGSIIGKLVNSDKKIKEVNKMKARIKAYAEGFVEALKANKVDMPSGGDCWGCNMREVGTGKEAFGIAHLESHMQEKYYVPSLLVNAMREAGYQDNQISYAFGNVFIDPKRQIVKYMQRRLIKL